MSEDQLEVYENRADHLSNNLRLNEISILPFFRFYFKIKRNQLKIVVKATHGLHPNKYFEILYLTFSKKPLVARNFGLYLNSRGADEIKGFPILIEFCNRNTELLFLLSIISSCFKVACTVEICKKSFFENSKKVGNNFIKNGIIYMNLPFIYKNPTILNLLKIVTLKFTMNILTILTYSLKRDIIGKQIFITKTFFNHTFNEHFLYNKIL